MKKSKDETIGPVKYAPKDRFKNKLVIHSKTGNFVDTERTDIKNGGKMKKRNNRVFEQDTAIKPEKSADRVEKSEVSTLDVDMFENIVRDLGRLSSVAAKMIDDIGSNNAQHYD